MINKWKLCLLWPDMMCIPCWERWVYTKFGWNQQNDKSQNWEEGVHQKIPHPKIGFNQRTDAIWIHLGSSIPGFPGQMRWNLFVVAMTELRSVQWGTDLKIDTSIGEMVSNLEYCIPVVMPLSIGSLSGQHPHLHWLYRPFYGHKWHFDPAEPEDWEFN